MFAVAQIERKPWHPQISWHRKPWCLCPDQTFFTCHWRSRLASYNMLQVLIPSWGSFRGASTHI